MRRRVIRNSKLDDGRWKYEETQGMTAFFGAYGRLGSQSMAKTGAGFSPVAAFPFGGLNGVVGELPMPNTEAMLL